MAILGGSPCMGGEAGDDCVYFCSREEAVGQGQELAGFPAHAQMAGKEPVHVVQDAAFCNGLGAPDAFLRRLEDDLYDAGEILTDGVQSQADEKPQGSVAIVAAGVHASAVFRRKAIFYRKAAGVHILAHIVAVDIKAQRRHRSGISGFDHSHGPGEAVHFLNDTGVRSLAYGTLHAYVQLLLGRITPEIIPVKDLFSIFCRDPVIFQRGNESGSGIKFLPSWLRMTVQVPAEAY